MVTCKYQNNKKRDALERITIARQSCPIKYNTTDNMIPEISSSHDHLVRLTGWGRYS